MDKDPGIICFRHCTPDNIFCKNIPSICPICRLPILEYSLEPFRVPYPCTNATHNSPSIIVIPSEGNFLDDYNIGSDLHIGIVNSKGIIFEFDRNGLIINDLSKWTNCITLRIVPQSWYAHWDEVLELMCEADKWKAYNYNDISMNCFNFVIEFLNNLGNKSLIFSNKEHLCEQLILPKIQDVVRYISLYRKLNENEHFVSK